MRRLLTGLLAAVLAVSLCACGSGTQDVVVTRERYPSYQGAVVVCEGAGDAAVRLALTEAVSALTGLSADRISIVQWKS